jgi:hypothetical protein
LADTEDTRENKANKHVRMYDGMKITEDAIK